MRKKLVILLLSGILGSFLITYQKVVAIMLAENSETQIRNQVFPNDRFFQLNDRIKCSSVDLDSSNNIYILGNIETISNAIPIAGDIPGFDTTYNGEGDGFVIKLDPTGINILYSSYIGGNERDIVQAIKIDRDGNAYITGFTKSSEETFPIRNDNPGFDKTYNGGYDGFVIKLDSAGTKILYSTYLGGTKDNVPYFYDSCSSIDVDAKGCAYMTGYTDNTEDSFPIGGKIPGFDSTYNGSDDAFVVKLDPTGSNILYSTYIGGKNNDRGTGIVIDKNGCAYITGYTNSDEITFPIGGKIPGFDSTYNGSDDAFLVKLDPTGSNILYSTYIGGETWDQSTSIDIDGENCAYITGYSYILRSTKLYTFPIGNGVPGYNTIYNGEGTFIVKINQNGTNLLYSTFLSGNSGDCGYSLKVDSKGCAYISGGVNSYNFPAGGLIPGFDKVQNGFWDAFVVKLNPSGTRFSYATFIGGKDRDFGVSITIDSEDCAYLVGETWSSPETGFPVNDETAGYSKTYNDGYDSFIIKLDITGTKLLLSSYIGLKKKKML